MVVLLRQRFAAFPSIEVKQSDILDFDLQSLKPKNINVLHKVVGNLPYNLTSPILRKLSEWSGWTFAVLMVQKEVADRLCAAPGSADYGALTVGMNLTTTTERVFDLSPKSFNPPPKVDSTVIRVRRRPTPLTRNIEGAQKVIQAAFQQRRKTILNSLSHGLGLEKPDAEKILSQCQIDPGIRPEKLPVQSFIDLADAWAAHRCC
jgi:16S rRNA (adenine1518-N6/adenine1519-N6)-dimethyltransferase